MPVELAPPKLFVSYSWTNEEHVEWVVALATRLMNDGIEVVLDQWDFKEGQDKYVFMEQMVTDPSVQKVLAVCDRRYAEKADGREGGVGTESQIISKDLYDKVKQEKFIPLIRERDDEGTECVPVFFRNRKYIDFCEDEQFEAAYEQLIRNIYGKPDRAKPALGKAPAHLLAESAPAVRPAAKIKRLRYIIEQGKPHAQAVFQEYLDEFLEDLELFRVKADPQSPEFDEAVVKTIADFLPHRDSFIDLILFVASYLDADETWDRVIAFFEGVAAFQQRPESVNSWNEDSFDGYRFIANELFLYAVAALLRAKRYSAAARLVEHRYVVTKTLGGTDFFEYGIGAFCESNHTLDERRNHRLRSNGGSSTATLIMQRASHSKVAGKDLIQADVLLFIRRWFPDPGGAQSWYPRLMGLSGRGGMTLEVFARATSDAGLSALKALLRVNSFQELAMKINGMCDDDGFKRSMWSDRLRYVNIAELLNWSEIARVAGIQLPSR